MLLEIKNNKSAKIVRKAKEKSWFK